MTIITKKENVLESQSYFFFKNTKTKKKEAKTALRVLPVTKSKSAL